MISKPFILFLNHVLAQEAWAGELLKKHADRCVCIDLDLQRWYLRITAAGTFEALEEAASVFDVCLYIKPADLVLIAHKPEQAVSYVKIEGDADLANLLAQLSRELRWEWEDDLSPWLGDVLTQRLSNFGKATLQHASATHASLQENFAEYFLEENPMLVRPRLVQAFGEQINQSRDAVERLMKRIEKLEKMKDSPK